MKLQTLLLCLCVFIVALSGHWLAAVCIWYLAFRLWVNEDKPKGKVKRGMDDDPFGDPPPPAPTPAANPPGQTVIRW